MGLLTRLIAPLPGEAKIPVHQMMAGIAEAKRGAPGVTVQSISTYFGLSAGDQATLQTAYDNYNGNLITRELIHDVLLLGELGVYTVNQVKNRLQV